MNNNTMIKKYKDVVKMTLFGRNDKLITDTTSIYSGYDRTLTTLEGGGIIAADVRIQGTIAFQTPPNIYITNDTNKFITPLT